jgi:hypothetical protein
VLAAHPAHVRPVPPNITQCLNRYTRCDLGIMKDPASNEEALTHGFRILSAYAIDADKPSKGHGENALWIITEADCGVTTF